MKFSTLISYLALSAICVATSTQNLTAQKIGLQLYSLRNEFKKDVPGTLAKIKEFNIKLIEGGGTYGMPMKEYQQLLKKNKLKMVSVGADFNQLDKSPQAVVDNAKAFGAKYVMCAWVPHKAGDFTMQEIDKAIEVFNRSGKLLAENGIKLCYHPHGYEFRPYKEGNMFDYMATKTDPKYVNFEMDVFWVKHPGQDPVALLQKYPTRFLMMHLKDRAPGTKGNQEGTAPDETNVVLGKGDVGIAAIMMEARKHKNIKYYFIEDESPHAEIQIPQSLQYLKSLK